MQLHQSNSLTLYGFPVFFQLDPLGLAGRFEGRGIARVYRECGQRMPGPILQIQLKLMILPLCLWSTPASLRPYFHAKSSHQRVGRAYEQEHGSYSASPPPRSDPARQCRSSDSQCGDSAYSPIPPFDPFGRYNRTRTARGPSFCSKTDTRLRVLDCSDKAFPLHLNFLHARL